jgi:hypothetical protein
MNASHAADVRIAMSLRTTARCLAVAFLATAGCQSQPAPAEETPPQPAQVATSRVVDVSATNDGFVPASIPARPGEAIVLRFTRTATSGCLSTIAVPASGVSRQLPLGQAVDVSVVAPSSGALDFQCGMGMVRGRIVVSDGASPTGSSSPAAASSGRAHADHDPRHGGILTMEGDYHVEIVVTPDGRVDLWVSDATRTPIAPADVTGSLEVRAPGGKGPTSALPLAGDAARGTVTARGPRTEEAREYTWDLLARGTKLHMTLAVPVGGTAKLAGATSPAARPSASAQHGAPGHRH